MYLDVLFPGAPAVDIAGLAYDNRAVGPRDLFFCVRGFTRDGHEFAPDAVARGAAALVVDHLLDLDIPQVVVADVRQAMAPAAAAFYGNPTATLDLVGVTGTNGKTTTAYLTRSLLEADGRRTGLLGTVKSVIGGTEFEVERTTPEAIDLQRSFRAMLDGGDVACVMEVSSHALELRRVDDSEFAVAVFTNLTQDHLDFHPTMEDYFQAKRRLFTEVGARHAVLNLDDPYGVRLATDPGIAAPVTFALEHAGATYRADDLPHGTVRVALHPPLARRRRRAQLAAAGPLQRLQRAGSVCRGACTGGPVRHRRRGGRARRAGSGSLRDRRRGPAVRRAGRLRAHARTRSRTCSPPLAN